MNPKNPQQSAHAVFDGVVWSEVSDFYWSGLTVLAGEFTAASLLRIGAPFGSLVRWAD